MKKKKKVVSKKKFICLKHSSKALCVEYFFPQPVFCGSHGHSMRRVGCKTHRNSQNIFWFFSTPTKYSISVARAIPIKDELTLTHTFKKIYSNN